MSTGVHIICALPSDKQPHFFEAVLNPGGSNWMSGMIAWRCMCRMMCHSRMSMQEDSWSVKYREIWHTEGVSYLRGQQGGAFLCSGLIVRTDGSIEKIKSKANNDIQSEQSCRFRELYILQLRTQTTMTTQSQLQQHESVTKVSKVENSIAIRVLCNCTVAFTA